MTVTFALGESNRPPVYLR